MEQWVLVGEGYASEAEAWKEGERFQDALSNILVGDVGALV
jgi:hypothetical protein